MTQVLKTILTVLAITMALLLASAVYCPTVHAGAREQVNSDAQMNNSRDCHRTVINPVGVDSSSCNQQHSCLHSRGCDASPVSQLPCLFGVGPMSGV